MDMKKKDNDLKIDFNDVDIEEKERVRVSSNKELNEMLHKINDDVYCGSLNGYNNTGYTYSYYFYDWSSALSSGTTVNNATSNTITITTSNTNSYASW